MPISAINTFTANRLDPLYDMEFASLIPVNLLPNTTFARGTVVGQITSAVNDVQTLTITATGGTFTITYTNPATGVQTTTASTAYNANASTQQTNINAVVGASAVVVTGTGPFVYTFSGTGVAGIAEYNLVVNTGSLTGGSASFAHTTQGSAAGVYKAYASGNSDGSQVCKGILQYDCVTDLAGHVYIGTTATSYWGDYRLDVPMYTSGVFDTTLLTGLDANAVTVLGAHLISGSVSSGIVRIG